MAEYYGVNLGTILFFALLIVLIILLIVAAVYWNDNPVPPAADGAGDDQARDLPSGDQERKDLEATDEVSASYDSVVEDHNKSGKSSKSTSYSIDSMSSADYESTATDGDESIGSAKKVESMKADSVKEEKTKPFNSVKSVGSAKSSGIDQSGISMKSLKPVTLAKKASVKLPIKLKESEKSKVSLKESVKSEKSKSHTSKSHTSDDEITFSGDDNESASTYKASDATSTYSSSESDF